MIIKITDDKIELKNKTNKKGIRITKENIKSWRRKDNGERAYSNPVTISDISFNRIKRIIKEGEKSDTLQLVLSDIKRNKTKFVLDMERGFATVIQYNVPTGSKLKYVKMPVYEKEYVLTDPNIETF